METFSQRSGTDEKKVDRIEIEYFTDPLCCWSWAFEPHWRRFINQFGKDIVWKYRMAGMIPDWNVYVDPMNDIARPAHMAPLWLQVKYSTHTPVDPDIWITDPPGTSLTSCMAVKCAALQSAAAEDLLLVSLRKAVMTRKRNIAKREVILEVAEEAALKGNLFDFEKFSRDFSENRGAELLKRDIRITQQNNIGRFPTLIMHHNGKGLIMTGYRPFSLLCEAYNQIAGVLSNQH